MVSQCVELHCTSYNVDAGLHGTHTTRAEATLICEQLTAVIVLLLADAEQAERDCIIASGLEVMYLPAHVGGKTEMAWTTWHARHTLICRRSSTALGSSMRMNMK